MSTSNVVVQKAGIRRKHRRSQTQSKCNWHGETGRRQNTRELKQNQFAKFHEYLMMPTSDSKKINHK